MAKTKMNNSPISSDGRQRVVIESVKPEVDAGRFAIKRSIGESVMVQADVFTDGHDAIACVCLYRRETAHEWSEAPMTPLGALKGQVSTVCPHPDSARMHSQLFCGFA